MDRELKLKQVVAVAILRSQVEPYLSDQFTDDDRRTLPIEHKGAVIGYINIQYSEEGIPVTVFVEDPEHKELGRYGIDKEEVKELTKTIILLLLSKE